MFRKKSLQLFAVAFLVATSSCALHWTKSEKAIINSDSDVLHVYTVNEPDEEKVLRTVCKDFTPAMLKSQEYSTLAEKLVATVTSPEQDGVGIAGPQVGISRRVVAVMRYDKDDKPFEVFPNIRITTFYGEKIPGPEGCLSVPGRRGDVLRYQDIVISYTDPVSLRDTSERVQGYTAVIFQHECDHLDGIVYTDYLSEGDSL